MILNKFILLTLAFCFTLGCKTLQIKKPVIISEKEPESAIFVPAEIPKVLVIDKESYTLNEISQELLLMPELDSSSNVELIENLVNRKLLEAEAKSLEYHKNQDFIEEVETYKKIILQKYLKNETYVTDVKNNTFENYKYEINASHIFIPISNFASSSDTLSLYNELLTLRNYSLKNNNFSILAKEWSKDSKTNLKGGNLGWFSALGIIYPMELVAFKTPVDSISLPIRTKFGYHLIKINGKRPNSGFVKVKHIFKYIKPGYDKATFDKNYRFMDSLTILLKNGANFDDFVMQYSDDLISKDKFGELPIFGIGTREESTFEEVAFNLKIGEISKPVLSSTGFHIIKLINKYNPDSKEDFLKKIGEKITTDSRGEYILEKSLLDISKSLNLIEYKEIKEQADNYIDTSILQRNWKNLDGGINNFLLFTLNNKNFLVKDFFDYILEKQKYEKWRPNETSTQVFELFYDKYLKKCLIQEKELSFLNGNHEIARMLDSQESDLLISKLLNDTVIDKSLEDTLSQRLFFETNKNLFPIKSNAKASSFLFKDKETYSKFETARNKSKPYQLKKGIKPLYYLKNEYLLNNEEKRKLIGLISIMYKNQGFIVEIGGHADNGENLNNSQLRIKEIVKFLVENGLPLTRISEIDFKNSKPQDRFDWSKNQRVTFQFFSDLEFDLIKSFNDKNPGSIYFIQTVYTKKEFELKYNIPWKTGIYKIEKNEKVEDLILEIYKENRTYKENVSEVINLYQKHLKEELIKRLRLKYSITLDSTEIEKTIQELKKNK